jgi:hypothetical protein
VKYKEQRFRGLHPAAFTYDEWQNIRAMTQSMFRASTRTREVKHVYEFAGYISCIHCDLPLRCDTGNTPDRQRAYYRDAAKARKIPCPTGGNLMVPIDLVHEQFGELLKGLTLPENWREMIRRDMMAKAFASTVTPETVEREKERLRMKKVRTLKQHRESYIDDEEFNGEMAAIALALKKLDVPEVDGVTYDEVIEAGEHIPGMAALWDVATVEECREMVEHILEPEGLYYDTELKIIAAMKPRPNFLPILRMLEEAVEYKETSGLLVTRHWSNRNRRAMNHRSHLALIPIDKLFANLSAILVYTSKPGADCTQSSDPFTRTLDNPAIISFAQRHPGPDEPYWKIPVSEWPNVVRRVVENQEPLCKVAGDYGVSYETVRRVVKAMQRQDHKQESSFYLRE